MLARLALAIFALLAKPAQANELFERFMAGSERFAAHFNRVTLAENPSLEEQMPPPKWDKLMITAGACTLLGYQTEMGTRWAREMVTRLEMVNRQYPKTAADLARLDAIVFEDMPPADRARIEQNCGLTRLRQDRLPAAGNPPQAHH